MAHLEMGMRLKERAHLEKAEAIFAEIGAEWDLVRARKVLQLYGVPNSGGGREIRPPNGL